MELAKIENLLEKYFEAKTTIVEEKVLKDYFSNAEVPEHLKEYKDMFNFFSESSLETSNRRIRLTRKKINIQWLSIAAMFIFFIGIYAVYQQNENEKEEARLAYVETQKALELISTSLNKGTGAIAQLDNFNRGTEAISALQTFEKTQNKIFNK